MGQSSAPGAAAAFFGAVIAVIILGGIGRAMLADGHTHLGWLWLGCWVGLIACGLAAWCLRRASRTFTRILDEEAPR